MVRKSSGCGTTTQDLVTINSGIVLQPGQHYLVASNTFSKISADQTYNSSSVSIADNGGVAIIDSANGIVDQVGMCNTTLYLEGTNLPPVPSMTTDKSYQRNIGGCDDTNDNFTDFNSGVLISPSNPQNMSSPFTYCAGVSTFTPTNTPSNTPTNTATFTGTATFTPTATSTSTPTVTNTSTNTSTSPPNPNANAYLHNYTNLHSHEYTNPHSHRMSRINDNAVDVQWKCNNTFHW